MRGIRRERAITSGLPIFEPLTMCSVSGSQKLVAPAIIDFTTRRMGVGELLTESYSLPGCRGPVSRSFAGSGIASLSKTPTTDAMMGVS
jgi:hypothetical protein